MQWLEKKTNNIKRSNDVKLKSGSANFLELRSAFEGAPGKRGSDGVPTELKCLEMMYGRIKQTINNE